MATLTLWKCFWANWFWPLLALILLGLAQMFWPGGKWRSIEHDVKQTVEQTLSAQGIDWATVKTHDRGRDVLLSGSAPTEEAKATALQLAREHAVYKGGYEVANRVDWEGDIVKPLVEGNLHISVVDGKVTLAGVVSSEAEKAALLDAAVAKYGADNVVDQLTVAENIKPFSGIDGILSAFDLNDGVLKIKDGQITLSGEVTSAELKDSIAANMAALLGSGYDISNRLKVKEVIVVPVENTICQTKLVELMDESKVYFESSKATIKAESDVLLSNISEVLQDCPKANILISGHTDNTGPESLNAPLSENRAKAVLNVLVAKGVPVERLSAQGFGSLNPIADNTNKEGRAINRRIEFTVK